MRKVTWTTLGLIGVSLLLCGSIEVLAQADTVAPQDTAERDATDTRVQGTEPGDARVGTTSGASPAAGTTGGAAAAGAGGSGVAGGGVAGTGGSGAAGGAGASTAEMQRTVLALQAEVAQLRQELAQVRAELANLSGSMGVGGSGQAGGAQVTGQAPVASQPTRQDTETTGTSAVGNVTQGNAVGTGTGGSGEEGEAVVNAIYTGTVRSVSSGRLVLLDEEGQPFSVELGKSTRVLRNGQRITAGQLERGTRVRATVDLLAGHNQATEIVALPASQ